MNGAINLLDETTWTEELISLVNLNEEELEKSKKIYEYLEDKSIIGFHYTRANPESIKKTRVITSDWRRNSGSIFN